MIDVRAEIEIKASPEAIWDYMVHLDRWWLRSNPKEHIALSLIEGDRIEEGAKFVLKEYIAGVEGEAIAEIKQLLPLKRLVWQSLEAHYKLFGIAIDVEEGGEFELQARGDASVLSHHVWGRVKSPLFGWLVESFFRRVLDGERKDFEHTLRELQFIKREVESAVV